MLGLTATVIAAGMMATAGAAFAAGAQFGERGFPGSQAPAAVTWRQSCGQIQALVNANNHAILTYGDRGFDARNLATAALTLGNHTRDRVVKDQRYCLLGEVQQPIWVPTRDTAQCFAGYTCASGDSWGRGRR